MAWGSTGRALPGNWRSIRERVFRRDGYRCTWRNIYGDRCEAPAEECDHIGNNADHSLPNLRALCHYHHAKHTASQAAEARKNGAWARQKAATHKRFRRTEEHPGLARGGQDE